MLYIYLKKIFFFFFLGGGGSVCKILTNSPSKTRKRTTGKKKRKKEKRLLTLYELYAMKFLISMDIKKNSKNLVKCITFFSTGQHAPWTAEPEGEPEKPTPLLASRGEPRPVFHVQSTHAGVHEMLQGVSFPGCSTQFHLLLPPQGSLRAAQQDGGWDICREREAALLAMLWEDRHEDAPALSPWNPCPQS